MYIVHWLVYIINYISFIAFVALANWCYLYIVFRNTAELVILYVTYISNKASFLFSPYLLIACYISVCVMHFYIVSAFLFFSHFFSFLF